MTSRMHPGRSAPHSDQARQRGEATLTAMPQPPETRPGRSRGNERVALSAAPPDLEPSARRATDVRLSQASGSQRK